MTRALPFITSVTTATTVRVVIAEPIANNVVVIVHTFAEYGVN